MSRIAGPSRRNAVVHLAITERELRALVRATCLVLDVLRRDPQFEDRWREEPPTLAVARSVLIAAAEREDIDVDALVSFVPVEDEAA